jgi:acyl-ACP thioesterase
MKKFLIGLGFAVLVSSVVFYRVYNKPHRDPSSEASIQITAADLLHSYETNETEANGHYLDKALEVSGKISEITINQDSIPVIVLETENSMFTVRCTMDNVHASAKVGNTVTIKGICTGYLSDVIIIKGTLVE